jgi:hypothetical protein
MGGVAGEECQMTRKSERDRDALISRWLGNVNLGFN